MYFPKSTYEVSVTGVVLSNVKTVDYCLPSLRRNDL